MIARTLAAVLVVGTGGLVDKVDLKHTYSAESKASYRFSGKLEDGNGQEIEFRGTLNVTHKELIDEGAVKGTLEVKGLELLINGSPGPDMGLDPFNTTFDKHGMPAEIRANEAEILYSLFGVSNFLPSSEAEVGGEYAIDWSGKGDAGSMKGKGTLVEVKEVEGKKVNVVKTDVELAPGGESPAHVVITSEFRQEDGQFLRCEGRIEMADSQVNFKFDAEE